MYLHTQSKKKRYPPPDYVRTEGKTYLHTHIDKCVFTFSLSSVQTKLYTILIKKVIDEQLFFPYLLTYGRSPHPPIFFLTHMSICISIYTHTRIYTEGCEKHWTNIYHLHRRTRQKNLRNRLQKVSKAAHIKNDPRPHTKTPCKLLPESPIHQFPPSTPVPQLCKNR